jgi:hypothetical protein
MQLLRADESFFRPPRQALFNYLYKSDMSTNQIDPSSIEKRASKPRNRLPQRTNAVGLTEEADRVLVRHLSNTNPETIKLEQVVKGNPQVFASYTQSKN